MNKNDKKTKKTKGPVGGSILFVLLLVLGVALDVVYATVPFLRTEAAGVWGKVCLFGGMAIGVLGLVGVLVCIAVFHYVDKQEAKRQQQCLQKLADEQAESRVTYIPAQQAQNLVTVGSYQTLEEKFAQIAKMDKTQFVIYVARLFSLNGYQVKLTPVLDNHDIDLLVEKMGVVIAVGCLISNRVLTKEDIVRVRNGRFYYNAGSCMALTNMYFDRTALEFAQAERMSLVDRSVLAEDFMC